MAPPCIFVNKIEPGGVATGVHRTNRAEWLILRTWSDRYRSRLVCLVPATFQ
jgi:hypothetical protein